MYVLSLYSLICSTRLLKVNKQVVQISLSIFEKVVVYKYAFYALFFEVRNSASYTFRFCYTNLFIRTLRLR